MTSYIGPSKGAVLQVFTFLIVSTGMTSVSIKYQNSRAKYAGDEKTHINQPKRNYIFKENDNIMF